MSNSLLEIIDIYKSFDIKEVHKGVSFALSKGERIGLLGASGTGKSVLLRSIVGLEFIDQGRILYNGERIDNLSEKDYPRIRKSISYSFQSGALFDSMNVFENLAFPLFEHTDLSLEEIDAKIHEVLKLIGLEGIQHLLPSDLSGGMQKRVGMARSMILNPDIILYDEPTAGLDPANTVNVVKVMKKFSDTGVTSIFVTHDIPAAKEFCDRIIILDKGHVAFDSTIEEFNNSDSSIVRKFLVTEGFENAN